MPDGSLVSPTKVDATGLPNRRVHSRKLIVSAAGYISASGEVNAP